jgi:hypothetical protein
MRAVRAVLLTAVVWGLTAAPAYAEPSPTGALCNFASVDSAADGTVTAEVSAALAFTQTDLTVSTDGGALACTVQVDAPTADGPDAAVAEGAYSQFVATVSGSVGFALPPGGTAYLCTSWRGADGTVRFYDRDPVTTTGSWSADPAAARCSLVTNIVRYQVTQCSDGRDNDGSGAADYPLDPGCASPFDPEERPALEVWACRAADPVVCFTIDREAEPVTYTAYLPDRTPAEVVAHLDVYEFVLPNGATAELPCLSATADVCAAAGGRFVRRYAALALGAVTPRDTGVVALGTVRACPADLVVTAGGFGVTRFPAYTVC